jgi:hypothetical protein
VAKDGKATKFGREAQITQVMAWMTRGYSRQDILAESASIWGLGKTSTDNLIRAARVKFVEQYQEVEREQIVAESLDRYNFLYKEGINTRQLAVSIAAQQAMAKMIGVDSPKTPKTSK